MKKLFELVNKYLEGTALHRAQIGKNSTLPIITISREKGSGGRPIAYLVAKQLKGPWQVFHKNIVEEIAHETTLDPELVEQLDEHQSSAVNELLRTMLGKKFLSMNAYYKHLLHVLASIGTRGYAIIVGRGANFLFPNALKVRIVARMEDRLREIIKYEHVSAKEAKQLIEESDKERNEFTSSLFQHDQRKAHHYDLVVRTSQSVTIDDATDLIVALAKKKFGI
ncbi:MAG: cytidylate kinase-like family protein [bacterium]